MTALNHFNHLAMDATLTLLAPCVALPAWAMALAEGRPYADRPALLLAAQEAMAGWGEAELNQALSTHPRIGEKPAGAQAHAALSRQEQSAVNEKDADLARALREGTARYEARFGRVFLIRAKGRSGEEILHALERRLNNSDPAEVQEALEQLREITLLRLEGVISA